MCDSGNPRVDVIQFFQRKTFELTAFWAIDFRKTRFNHAEQIQDTLFILFLGRAVEVHTKKNHQKLREKTFSGEQTPIPH